MRGGPRKNAGRKAYPEEIRRRKVTLALLPETIELLKKSELSMAKTVEQAVSEFMKNNTCIK